MKKHIKSQHDGKIAEFKCNHCNENVNTARNLTRHMSNKHEKLFDIPVIIEECLFQKIIHFKHHIKIKHIMAVIVCPPHVI